MLRINGNLGELNEELSSENEMDRTNEQLVVEESHICVNNIQTSSDVETAADHSEHEKISISDSGKTKLRTFLKNPYKCLTA